MSKSKRCQATELNSAKQRLTNQMNKSFRDLNPNQRMAREHAERACLEARMGPSCSAPSSVRERNASTLIDAPENSGLNTIDRRMDPAEGQQKKTRLDRLIEQRDAAIEELREKTAKAVKSLEAKAAKAAGKVETQKAQATSATTPPTISNAMAVSRGAGRARRADNAGTRGDREVCLM